MFFACSKVFIPLRRKEVVAPYPPDDQASDFDTVNVADARNPIVPQILQAGLLPLDG